MIRRKVTSKGFRNLSSSLQQGQLLFQHQDYQALRSVNRSPVERSTTLESKQRSPMEVDSALNRSLTNKNDLLRCQMNDLIAREKAQHLELQRLRQHRNVEVESMVQSGTSQMKSEIEQLKSMLQATSRQMMQALSEREQVKNQKEQLSRALEETTQNVANQEHTNGKLSEVQKELATLQEKLRSVEATKVVLEKSLKEETSNRSQLASQVFALRKDNEKTKTELETLKLSQKFLVRSQPRGGLIPAKKMDLMNTVNQLLVEANKLKREKLALEEELKTQRRFEGAFLALFQAILMEAWSPLINMIKEVDFKATKASFITLVIVCAYLLVNILVVVISGIFLRIRMENQVLLKKNHHEDRISFYDATILASVLKRNTTG
eukprot:Gb_35815 [translate_table: standard]